MDPTVEFQKYFSVGLFINLWLEGGKLENQREARNVSGLLRTSKTTGEKCNTVSDSTDTG